MAVYERQIFHLIKSLDDLVDSLGVGPADQIELHGNAMYGGKGHPWRGIDRAPRHEIMNQTLGILMQAFRTTRAFGVVVNKAAKSPEDPVEYAFEEICNRFNQYLYRVFRSRGGREEDKQKGLIVMDNSHYEEPLQALASQFRIRGTRWGHLRNLAEVPFFVDSRASRIVQLADLVAFAMWRKYEHKDGRFFDRIVPRFDNEGGVIHGLVHFKPHDERCYCPACMSRLKAD